MARSAYDTFRKRIAPVAFLAALVFLATRTCSSETASVTIVFDLGTDTSQVRSLEVELARGDQVEPVARFKSNSSNGEATARRRWKLRIDPGTYTLHIRIATDRRTYRATRTAEVRDGAEIVVPLKDVVPRPPESARGP